MSSLVEIYKALFEVEKYQDEINDKNIYNLDGRFNLEPTQKQNENNSLDTIIYKIFIHIMLSLLLENKNKEQNKDNISFLKDNLTLVDWKLVNFFQSSFFDISKQNFYSLNINHFHFKIKKSLILELKNYLKENNYQVLENESFYKNLIEIQRKKLIINSKLEISLFSNENDQKLKGQYYTPKIITDLMMDLLNSTLAEGERIISVLDPACGSGLFLNSYLNKNLNNKNNQESTHSVIEGRDIDFKSLLTGSLTLAYQFLYNDIFTSNLSIKLTKEDFLLTQVNNIKYDLIIGNPPYIRERFFDKKYRKQLQQFQTYYGKSDLYFVFIEQALYSLHQNGYLVFLLPRYWLESNHGSTIRELIRKHFTIKVLIDFRNFKLFTIGVHSSLIIAKKTTCTNKHALFSGYVINTSNIEYSLEAVIEKLKNYWETKEYSDRIISKVTLNQFELTDSWLIQSNEIKELLKKLNSPLNVSMKSIAIIKEGINTGADKIARHHTRIHTKFADRVGAGIFVLNDNELQNLGLTGFEKEKFIKKWIKGKNISKWIVHSQVSWLIYFTKETKLPENILKHLSNYKEILENRAEIKRNSRRKWYELAWPRKDFIFDSRPKLLIRYKSKIPIVALDNSGYYTSADFRILIIKEPYNPYIILALLNSNVIKWILSNQTKKLGVIQDYYSYTLESLYIKYPKSEIEKEMINKVENLIKLLSHQENNFNPSNEVTQEITGIEKELNQIIYQLYELNSNEIRIIEEN